MTPAERTALWRKDNPPTKDVALQQAIVQGWIVKPDTCPYVMHPLSYEIRSKRAGRKQAQLILKGVRLSRASVTWYLLHDKWLPPESLDFAPRLQSIQQRSDLE
jgi:hypothetical protein